MFEFEVIRNQAKGASDQRVYLIAGGLIPRPLGR